MLAFSGVLCAAGLILWGVGPANKISGVGLIFGLGMLAFSVISGGSLALSYDVDWFKVIFPSISIGILTDVSQEIAGETMISVIIIRNTLGFAVSWGINPWITGMGLQNCFITVAMVSLACSFSFLLMIFFGKSLRNRSKSKYWEYVATSAAPRL
jgi:hypothetical protein